MKVSSETAEFKDNTLIQEKNVFINCWEIFMII